MREIKTGRVYRHFKGDFYLVEATAFDSETGEEVDREKYPDVPQKYRFELIEIESKARH